MKLTVFLAVSCAVVAVIYGEFCRDIKDCDHETCDSSSKLGCSHGECTCLTSATAGSCAQSTCKVRADCNSCKCRDSRQSHHCYDGHCFCGFGGFETCRDEKDCDHVTCDSSSKRGCSHGECTCLTSATAGSCAQANCTARADCDGCRCRDSRASHHCYDGHCLCGRGFGPGIGK